MSNTQTSIFKIFITRRESVTSLFVTS